MADLAVTRIAPVAMWTMLAGINGLTAVAAGAYGRHAPLSADGREMFVIGSQYQMAHALALFGVAWLAGRSDQLWLSWVQFAGANFTLGIVLFCGTLYWFGITGDLPVAGAAPVGGFLLMLGWLSVTAISARSLCRSVCFVCGGESCSTTSSPQAERKRLDPENKEAGTEAGLH